MTLTTTDRPPSAPTAAPELLIKEARLRARRKRLRVGTIVLVVAAILVTGLYFGGDRHHTGRPTAPTRQPGGVSTAPIDSSVSASVLVHSPVNHVWPVSATTAWVDTQSATTIAAGLLRTTDGGALWRNVAPTNVHALVGNAIAVGAFALSANDAWLTYARRSAPLTTTVLATTDGGHAWTRRGTLPAQCDIGLQFTSPNTGWCSVLGAAAGSELVTLYRTLNGGTTWTKVSHNSIDRTPQGGLPFACDKSLQFVSDDVGWTRDSFCNGGVASLFVSRNGGLTWRQSAVVTPSHSFSAGSSIDTTPVIVGERGVVSFSAYDPTESFLYVTTNGGASFHPQAQTALPRAWSLAALTPFDWLVFGNHDVYRTTDAGRTWTKTSSNMNFGPGASLQFTTLHDGWFLGTSLWRTTDGGHVWTRVELREAVTS